MRHNPHTHKGRDSTIRHVGEQGTWDLGKGMYKHVNIGNRTMECVKHANTGNRTRGWVRAGALGMHGSRKHDKGVGHGARSSQD